MSDGSTAKGEPNTHPTTVGGERRILDQSDPSRDPAILLAGFVELRHVGDLEIARRLQIIGPRLVNFETTAGTFPAQRPDRAQCAECERDCHSKRFLSMLPPSSLCRGTWMLCGFLSGRPAKVACWH